MVLKFPQYRILLLACPVLVFIFLFAACAWAAGEKVPDPASFRREVEQQAWDEAMKAFDAGDYARARITFDVLSDSSESLEMRRKALFALAASKLMLAQTPEEYADAVSIWERWSSQITSLEGEDPRMVTPFLRRFDPAAQSAAKNNKAPENRKVQKNSAALDSFKGLLQNKEKEVEVLRSKLDMREREIRRLRHQLESLDEIHRKYQEKKQEASTP